MIARHERPAPRNRAELVKPEGVREALHMACAAVGIAVSLALAAALGTDYTEHYAQVHGCQTFGLDLADRCAR